ncbi:undecaprenyl-diphosphate phosphatase [Leptospira sp. GIMC2001]|uniref:undecaprenyl-diphosphate phosphatase n=1 Tax=Leptospira sp. GIMC2001 TaxID=1513297 RepID=UPI00234AAE9A|nr:undecaprenyl-diphosphate phosphatase [Leptospira sp. GIMC2001]WCL48059.1 undecaprenyl-diphosphate phosphatase [Leptospira sp. GIMC2001]
MSDYLNATLRAVLEAITEFLPVSSTGHLFLFANFFPFVGFESNREDFEDLFDIFIQSGAILSVIYLYFARFKKETVACFLFFTRSSKDDSGFKFLLSLLIGSLPIMAIGFLFRNLLDGIKSGENLLGILGLAWLLGGFVILFQEIYFKKNNQNESNPEHTSHQDTLTIRQSFVIGIVQCIALIPGVSRSLATIIAGRSLGLSRQKAAEYSFFLAVPVLVAAGIYKLWKHRHILDSEKLLILFVGSFISFVLCVFIIRWFIDYVRRYNFNIFGYYRIILGSIVLFYIFLS